jgi:hypothetical protein
MSWVNTQLLILQEKATQAVVNGENAMYYALHSISMFPYHLCNMHKHKPPLGGEVDEMLHLENAATNSYMTSIKWTYSDIIIPF